MNTRTHRTLHRTFRQDALSCVPLDALAETIASMVATPEGKTHVTRWLSVAKTAMEMYGILITEAEELADTLDGLRADFTSN